MDDLSPQDPTNRAIADATAALVAALNAGNPRDAAALYAEDARLLPPAAPVIEGREAVEAFWRAGLESGVADVQLEPLEVDHREGVAYELGRYRLRLTATAERAAVNRGSYLVVHQRQPDGEWRRAIETFNPDGTPFHRSADLQFTP
jgi:uncharacterized protein (TIGR02246 family)